MKYSVLLSALATTAAATSLRNLHTDASPECAAGLETVETQFGLDIIMRQEATAAYWALATEGYDIRLVNHDAYPDLECTNHNATTCSGSPISMTLTQASTGATLYDRMCIVK